MAAGDTGIEYRLPDELGIGAILAYIGERRRLAQEPAELRFRGFYDSFDWSVYGDGGILELAESPEGLELLWRCLGGDAPVLRQPVSQAPGWPADLPTGPVRSRILAPCGIRRLLLRMQIETRVRTVRVLDDEDKTVVRLGLSEQRFSDPELGIEGPLPARLEVHPVRGYDAERDALLALLTDGLALAPADRPVLLDALAAAGRRPADYSSKLDYRLDPAGRADAVTRSILLGLLDTMERNLPGARANLDSEFLHDLRVAVRRTRSALAQIREVFPSADVALWKERFAWLQQVTGPVRDLDVYLLDFDGYRDSLPESLRPHLAPLRTFILTHYDEEQARLAAELGSPRLAEMLRDWRGFLESPLPADPQATDALKPVKEVADERIRRMAKRVRKEGRAIGPDSPPAEMHELRKSCKKLRYLMEFFQSLYPDGEVRELVKLMKTILDNLGNFQDLSVQAEHLREMAARMREEGLAETDTLLAMGTLIGDLLARRQRAREGFASVFAGFLGDENRRRLKALFASPAQDPETPDMPDQGPTERPAEGRAIR